MGSMLDEQGQLGAVRDLPPGRAGTITLAEAGGGRAPSSGRSPDIDTPARSVER